ncbi:MAG: hypothetical protein IPN20_00840 [Haliscomenobacter sp.]|nr:hypothetical protein [Haliscomenobacter sp.]
MIKNRRRGRFGYDRHRTGQVGLYRVIERQQLNVLLAEQDLGASGVVTAESAAKMGQVLGVEIAVVGAVTEFGYKKNETNISIAGKRLGVGAQTAVMALDIRLVNTTTGEILMADNVRRNRSVPSGSIGIGRVSFSNQQSFDETMVGKVAREAGGCRDRRKADGACGLVG